MAAIDIVSERSFEPLTTDDLCRLADLAMADLMGLFDRRPETGRRYRDRLLLLALCQGGAEHFVRQTHGVKDLDVWAFFSAHPQGPFPHRRRGIQDFGPSRHGRHPDDDGFNGRRIDIMGRSIPSGPDQSAEDCIRAWLVGGKTRSTKLIALRPVVAIHPANARGKIVWDPIGSLHVVRTT